MTSLFCSYPLPLYNTLSSFWSTPSPPRRVTYFECPLKRLIYHKQPENIQKFVWKLYQINLVRTFKVPFDNFHICKGRFQKVQMVNPSIDLAPISYQLWEWSHRTPIKSRKSITIPRIDRPQLKPYTNYAPVKLFCPHPPHRAAPVRGKMCVIKKGWALEHEVKKGRDTRKWRD